LLDPKRLEIHVPNPPESGLFAGRAPDAAGMAPDAKALAVSGAALLGAAK